MEPSARACLTAVAVVIVLLVIRSWVLPRSNPDQRIEISAQGSSRVPGLTGPHDTSGRQRADRCAADSPENQGIV